MRRHLAIAALLLFALTACADDAALRFAGVVLYPDGRPAAGAKVWLVNQADDAGQVVATGETDADGRFSVSGPRIVDGLLAEYCVCAKADGHAFAWVGRMTEAESALELAAEQARTLAGNLRGVDGEPVAGVRPMLCWVQRPAGFQRYDITRLTGQFSIPPELQQLMVTETDADGDFTLANLPSGVNLTVTAMVPGAACFEQSYAWSELGRGGAVQVHLMEPGIVRGRVVDAATGNTIPGVTIHARRCEGPGDGGVWQGRRGEVRTVSDARGEYEIRDLADYTYALRVHPALDAPWYGMVGKVAVRRGEVTEGIDIECRQGVEVHGTVSHNVTHAPVPGAVIEVGWRTPNGYSAPTSTAVSAAGGRYQLVMPPNGAYICHRLLPRGLMGLGGGSGYMSMPGLTAEDDPRAVDFRVVDGPAVHGTVLGPEGPAAGARVLLVRAYYPDGPRETVCDAAGRFTFDGVHPKSDCMLHAWRGNDMTLEPVVVAADTGQEAMLRLSPDARTELTGRIVTASGHPIANAEVVVRTRISAPGVSRRHVTESACAHALTDAAGRYVLRGCWPGAHIELFGVGAPGYEPFGDSMREHLPTRALAPGQRLDMGDTRLAAAPAGMSVHGIVLDTHGKPVPHIVVEVGTIWEGLTIPTYMPRSSTVADAHGEFSFHNLPAEHWVLIAASPNHSYLGAGAGPEPSDALATITLVDRRELEVFTHVPEGVRDSASDATGLELSQILRRKQMSRTAEGGVDLGHFLVLMFTPTTQEKQTQYGVRVYDDVGREVRAHFLGNWDDGRVRASFDLPEADVRAFSRVTTGPTGINPPRNGRGEPIRFDDLLPRTAQESSGARAVLWHSELCAAPVDVVYAPGVAQPEGKRYVSTRVYVTCPDAMELGFSSGSTSDGIELQAAGRIFYCEGMKSVSMPEAFEQYRGLLEVETREALAKLSPPDGPPARAVWGFWLRSRGDVQPGRVPARVSVELAAFARGSASIYNIPIPPELTRAVEME